MKSLSEIHYLQVRRKLVTVKQHQEFRADRRGEKELSEKFSQI